MATRISSARNHMRKEPRQARSRATVASVVEAGARILGKRGWAGFTTNEVAEVAGVSIGSLYQYFPNKHALIEAILHRHMDDCLAVMRETTSQSDPILKFVEHLVDDMISVHTLHPGLHRVLQDERPSFESTKDANSPFEMDYLACYAKAVASYRKNEAGVSSETVGTIISDALDGVIHNAIRRGTLESPTIKKELVRMIGLYLADA
jgi:AcrR family transcriptional regulator